MSNKIDFDSAWKRIKKEDPNGRLDSETDLAFWQGYAKHYDNKTAPNGSYEETLKQLKKIVCTKDTLLDVGAGTGRFAVPLSSIVKKVTALDHSPAMIEILKDKINNKKINNIDIIKSAWETTETKKYDVVLASWSLYRQYEIKKSIKKLVDSAKRVLVIVDGSSTSYKPVHEKLINEIWKKENSLGFQKTICFLAILWELGIPAEVNIVFEKRVHNASTPKLLAKKLAPKESEGKELDEFTKQMMPYMIKEEDEWKYVSKHPVEIITWYRNSDNKE